MNIWLSLLKQMNTCLVVVSLSHRSKPLMLSLAKWVSRCRATLPELKVFKIDRPLSEAMQIRFSF